MFVDGDFIAEFLNGVSFFQAMLKNVTVKSRLWKPFLGLSLPSLGFETLTYLHSSSVVIFVFQKKAVSAYLLPGTDNMICFAVQTMERAFMVLAKPSGLESLAQLMALKLLFNHELGEFKALVSQADG